MSKTDTQTIPDLSCAEFQASLPEFLTSDGTSDDPAQKAHLASCGNCSALIRDLKYIAEEARRIFEPSNDLAPSDALWSKIKDQIKHEPANPQRE